MKTAVSIPDPVFEAAEELARRLGLTRSGLYALALKELTSAHERSDLESAMNEAIEQTWGERGDPGLDEGVRALQTQTVVGRSEW